MATKKTYSEEFKRKVVEEYKKGDLSLKNVARKYKIPPALLQDWVNKAALEDYVISVVPPPVVVQTIWGKTKANLGLAYNKFKANGWLLAGCLPLLIPFFTFLTCSRQVIESEMSDNSQSTTVKIDSMISVSNNINAQLGDLNATLQQINKKLNLSLSPTTIIYDYRRWKRSNKTNIRSNSHTSVSNEHNGSTTLINSDSVRTGSGHGYGCCCCSCKKDSVR